MEKSVELWVIALDWVVDSTPFVELAVSVVVPASVVCATVVCRVVDIIMEEETPVGCCVDVEASEKVELGNSASVVPTEASVKEEDIPASLLRSVEPMTSLVM